MVRRWSLERGVQLLDRHVEAGIGDRVAFYFEGEPGDRRTITYAQLLDEVGVARTRCGPWHRAGDRVAIYMPMIPSFPCDAGVRADRAAHSWCSGLLG